MIGFIQIFLGAARWPFQSHFLKCTLLRDSQTVQYLQHIVLSSMPNFLFSQNTADEDNFLRCPGKHLHEWHLQYSQFNSKTPCCLALDINHFDLTGLVMIMAIGKMKWFHTISINN